MKRIVLIICVAICGTLQGYAQIERQERTTNPDDTLRYLSSTMSQNWFINAFTSANWWQGSDRNPAGNYTSLNGPTLGGGVSIGKWITHNVAFRLAYEVNKAHSYIDGYHTSLPNIQFLFKDNYPPDENGYVVTTFVYHNFHGDFLLSPIDLLQGYYNPERPFTPIFFAGMGMACVSGKASMIQTVLGGSRNFEYSFEAGFIGLFKLNPYLDLSTNLMLSSQKYCIDSWYCEYGAHGTEEPRPRRTDLNYTWGLGLNWNIRSRIYELPYNYSNEMREQRARINRLEDELDECLKSPKPVDTVTLVQYVNQVQTDTVTATEIVSFPFSIFFERDSYQLMSRRDLVNLREIARIAYEKGWKLRLRGSCDSATATPEYNQRLSENRCNKIKLELLDMGIPEDQMILVPVGGVHELDPTEYDRRVLIELVKEIK